MTILVADDHPMFRKALINFLKTNKYHHARLLDAGSGKEVMHILQDQEVNLLLLDVQMPHMNGYEVVQAALHQRPQLKIIMLSMIDSKDAVRHFLGRGVRGYITKGIGDTDIEDAIDTVLRGDIYVEKRFDEMFYNRELREAAPTLRFSPQEMQVLQHLSRGLNAAGIGETMGLSVRTIEDYKATMMKKAQVKNAAELVRFFYENGLN